MSIDEFLSDFESIARVAETNKAAPTESSRPTEYTVKELKERVASEPERLTAGLGPIVAEKVFPEIAGNRVEHSVFADGVILTPSTKAFYRSSFASGAHVREYLTLPVSKLQQRIKAPDSDALAFRLLLDEDLAAQYHVPRTIDDEDLGTDLSLRTLRKDSATGTKNEPEPDSPRARSNANLVWRERTLDSLRMRPGGSKGTILPAGPVEANTYSGYLALEPATYNRVDGRLTVPLETETLIAPAQVFLENDGVEAGKSLLENYLPKINPGLTKFLKDESNGQRRGFVTPDRTLLVDKFLNNFDILVLSPDLAVLKDLQNPDDKESVVVMAQRTGKDWWYVERFHLTADEQAGIKINTWLLGLEGAPVGVV